MRAGILDTRVSLQRKTSGKDAYGEPINTWTEYGQVWANVSLLTGKETAKGSGVVTQANGSIRIRFRRDVTSGDRVVEMRDDGPTGMVFNIAAVLPNIDSREYADLVVNTGANEG